MFLQKAWVNNKKVSPPRMAIVALIALISTIICLFISIWKEFLKEEERLDTDLYKLIRSTLELIPLYKKK